VDGSCQSSSFAPMDLPEENSSLDARCRAELGSEIAPRCPCNEETK